MEKYTVMIVYGGEGYEREVSRDSARSLERIKQDNRLLPIFVYISEEGRWYVSKSGSVTDRLSELSPLVLSRGGFVSGGIYRRVDLALVMMHGDRGEDGYISACLQSFKIKCYGSPYYTSALVRDKAAVKLFARDIGIETTDFAYFPEGADPSLNELSCAVRKLGFPLFVKPRRLGSSVGASRASDVAELVLAVERASLPFGGGVLIERFVSADIEAECGFLEHPDRRFAVGAVLTGGREYSYERKYLGVDGIPAENFYPRADSERDEIIKRSERLISALGIRGMCRVDFLVTGKGEILFNEINLIPGFTDGSLFPRLFFKSDSDMADWVFVAARSVSERAW